MPNKQVRKRRKPQSPNEKFLDSIFSLVSLGRKLKIPNLKPINNKSQDFIPYLIGKVSLPGEKLFRLGTSLKVTHPAWSDMLQASAIIITYYSLTANE